MIELHEWRERRLRELLQPVAHGAGGGQPGQAAEPRDEGIADEILHVFKTAGADVEQPHDEQRNARAAIVTRDRGERRPQPRDDRQLPEVALDELEAPVRREPLRDKLDGQITLDRVPQAPYLQAHQRGLLALMDDMGMSLHSMRRNAPLMHFGVRFRPSRISDQGCAPSRAILLRVEVPPHPRRGDA